MAWWDSLKFTSDAKVINNDELSLFRNSSFSRLWGSQILSQIAQQLLNFALIVRVFDLAQHSKFANISVALVVLSFGVPSIFFAAAAGVFVDHWNKKTVLLTSNIIRGILVVGYLFVESNLGLVLLLTFLISSTTQFFAPAEAALMPELVGPKQLLRANSLFIFTLYGSFIVGYGLASPIIALYGPQSPYFITSSMFLIAALFVMGLPKSNAVEKARIKLSAVIKFTKDELSDNFKLIKAEKNLSFPILELTVSQAMVGVILALAPAISVALIHKPLQNASQFLIVPAGLGMIIGVIAIGNLVKKYTKLTIITLSMLIASITLTLLGVVGIVQYVLSNQSIPYVQMPLIVSLLIAGLILVLGFMNGVISIASQTLIQENTTEETRGKVFGALNMMVNIAATLPILFASVLADILGVTSVIVILGCIMIIFSMIQLKTIKNDPKYNKMRKLAKNT